MPKSAALLQIDVVSTDAMLDTGAPLIEPGLNADIAQRLITLGLGTSEGQPLEITVRSAQLVADALPAVVSATQAHFERCVGEQTLRIGEILRQARLATLFGLGFVAVLLAIAGKIPDESRPLLLAVRESLTIFAWVTMWRPAELWLYDHLPERRLRRLAKRLRDAQINLVALN